LSVVRAFNFCIKRVAENSLITNRKQSALKVLTNTVHSTKKPDSKSLKHLKVMPMKSFQAETNCKSSARDSDFNQYEDFSHVGCVIQDNGNFLN